MSWDLTRLEGLDPESAEFEAERSRLIKAEIEKVPLGRRQRLIDFQFNLDLFRATHTSEEFMIRLTHEFREQIENLEDASQFFNNTLVKKA